MSHKEDILDESGLSIEESALLAQMLKGDFSGKMREPEIPTRDVFSPVPLSFGQRRLWILDQIVPGNAFYNISLVYRIEGEFDPNAFKRSVNEIVRRHESLRTIFKIENEEPVQVILPQLTLDVPIISLEYLSGLEQEDEILRLAGRDAMTPTDLSKGPLMRVTLLRLSSEHHVLLYTTHHIVSDTWSTENFIQELVTCYSAYLSGKTPQLEEISVQYPDFALWQRQRMQGERLEKQFSYWRQVLGPDIPILELPADRQRPAVQTFRGETTGFVIQGDLCKKIIALTHGMECSLFMFLLAALSILFCRYSGQEDILVGSPIANRTRKEIENLIGYFSNTLVFRTDLSGNPSFRQVLERVRRVTSGAYDNQDIPFEKLVEEFQPERYMSLTPLFQVMMVLQNVPKQQVTLPDANFSIRPISIHNKTCKFDLWISITQIGEILSVGIEYNSDIFNISTIKRLVNHFKILLQEIVLNPEKCISDFDILSSAEKKQLLIDWNDTGRDYELRCIHHMFEDQVEKTPDFPAVKEQGNEDSVLGYRELDEKSGQLAELLRKKGVRADTVVGIMFERSREMVIGLLGILKAGGAYLPLDPEYPEERIAYMLKDSDVNLLITTAELAKEVTGMSNECEIIDIDRLEFSAFASSHWQPGHLPVSHISNLSYVIYTSGSTGQPKGVMISHGGICNRLLWMQETYGLTSEDRVLQKTPFSFDVSVWEFFLPLLNGAELVMAVPGGHRDSAYLVEAIYKEKITTIHFVPSMLNMFLEEPEAVNLNSLRRVICSGEALPLEYVERFFSCFPGETGPVLHNLYGPTEASVDVTYWPCIKNPPGKTIPIGRPITNTQIYILDRHLDPVAVGIPGQLFIGGIQLARGYINHPELTATQFINPPPHNKKLLRGVQGGSFLEKSPPGSRRQKLYQTGDLAKWSTDGTIEFLGRLDFQVKVRGFRIELGEIESTLRKHKAMQEAVVLAREDGTGGTGKKLTAYSVPDSQYWQKRDILKADETGLQADQVDDWQGVFDEAYTGDAGQSDPTFNIVGWNSSYTGEPIPAEQMRLWVDHTVEQILSLKARDIMEIGCGTGLFLFRLIPHCRRYLGTDIAQQGLNYIRRQLEQDAGESVAGNRAEVELKQCSAEQFEGISPDQFDLVILNSVVQYFPSVDYLVEVLTGAVERVKPGGHIFIGDVRNLILLKTFHTSVEFYRAEPGTGREQLQRRIMNKMSLEQELVIHPGFFFALKNRVPKIRQVELRIKAGRYNNELSGFRYDVILHIGSGENDYPEIQPELVWDFAAEWQAGAAGIEEIGQRLTDLISSGHEPKSIVVANVPNSRTARDFQVLKWLTGTTEASNVDEYRKRLQESKLKEPGIDPNDFLEMGRQLPYHIRVVLPCDHNPEGAENAGNIYHVIFRHRDHKMEPGTLIRGYDCPADTVELHPWHMYTNNPLLIKISGQLTPELRDFLKERLPEYMVPSHFVFLNRLPLTANGKLDRQELLLHEPMRMSAASASPGQETVFVEPSTPIEKLFSEIWASVLFVEKVGITDNFFELGGDSINAIQVISRANKQGYGLTIRDLYQNLTIPELVHCAEKSEIQRQENPSADNLLLEVDKEELIRGLPGVEVEAIHPLTSFQKHMLNHYLQDPARENEPGLFITYRAGRLPYEQMDIALLEEAFQKVAEIYPYLRTAFMWKNLKEPVQIVHKKVEPGIQYYDFSDLPEETRESRLLQLTEEDYNQGFERDKPSVYRITIIKMSYGDYRYILTADYMRVDGWSTTLVLNSFVFQCFALAAGNQLEIADYSYSDYRNFHSWLQQQDTMKGQHFWQGMLEGCTFPTPLAENAPGNKPQQRQARGFTTQHRYLSVEETTNLEYFIKQNQLVLSTLGWAAWAMVLSKYAAEEKVIFGILVSGRSSAQAFVETMVGQTLNVLPARLEISPEKPLIQWIREIWEIQMELSQYEYTPQDKIRQWWNIPPDKHLFESYLVVMNFPGIRQGMKESKQSARTVHDYIAQLEYPLRVDFYPGPELCLIMHYYRHYFNDAVIGNMLDDLFTLINEIPEHLHGTTQELMDTISRKKDT